jgi:tetratricopeptide (TPR) repeat protein
MSRVLSNTKWANLIV